MKSISLYSKYIDQIKKLLKKNLFKTKLEKLSSKAKKSHKKSIQHAYAYYERHYQQKPIVYQVDKDSNISYQAKDLESLKIQQMSIGTFAIKDQHPSVVNFYQVLSNYHQQQFETYRFGTPLHYFQDVKDIVKHFEEFQSKKKKFISISLITPCNTPFCKTIHTTFKPLQHIAKPIKSAFHATLEQPIIDIELKANHKKISKTTYYTILFPMTQQYYKGVGHRLLLSPSIFQFEKNKYKKMVKDKKVAKLYDYIHLDKTNDGETGFKSIVDMTCYYYLYLHKKYALGYHCRSGKDRTSVFDAIVQSTLYHISSLKTFSSMNDIDDAFYYTIREYSKKFLIYGLLIAFGSTGIVGLKLKTVPIAYYLFQDDHELFLKYVGDSKYAET